MVWDESVERRGAREAAETLPRFHIFSHWWGCMYVFVYSCPSADVSVSLGALVWVWQRVIERLQEETERQEVTLFFTMTRFTSPYALSVCIRTIYYKCFLCSMYCTLFPALQYYSVFDQLTPAQTASSWPYIFFNNNAYSRAQIHSALSNLIIKLTPACYASWPVEWLLLYNRSTLLFPQLVRKEKTVLTEAIFCNHSC